MAVCRTCEKEIQGSGTTCPKCAESVIDVPVDHNGIPEGIKGWSWGAFLLSWIWAIGNRTWIGLLALIPYVGFIMAIVLGIKGREWAWKNGHWESIEQFNRVQRRWSAWGVGLVGGVMGIGITAAIALPAYNDYVQRAKFGAVLQTLASAEPVLVDSMNSGASIDASALARIRSLAATNPAISNVDAFTAGNYADVGSELQFGGERGTLWLVTTDGGNSWTCQTTLTRLGAKQGCEVVEGIVRPEVSATVGRWDRAFAQQVIDSCIANTQGDANAATRCTCVVEKVATILPQEAVGDGTSAAYLNETQLAGVACATRETTASN